MYARRYPPPTEEITVPENYSGSQFERPSAREEAKEREASAPQEPCYTDSPALSEAECEGEAPLPCYEDVKAAPSVLGEDILLLLALLLSESKLGENIEFLLMLLLLF